MCEKLPQRHCVFALLKCRFARGVIESGEDVEMLPLREDPANVFVECYEATLDGLKACDRG